MDLSASPSLKVAGACDDILGAMRGWDRDVAHLGESLERSARAQRRLLEELRSRRWSGEFAPPHAGSDHAPSTLHMDASYCSSATDTELTSDCAPAWFQAGLSMVPLSSYSFDGAASDQEVDSEDLHTDMSIVCSVSDFDDAAAATGSAPLSLSDSSVAPKASGVGPATPGFEGIGFDRTPYPVSTPEQRVDDPWRAGEASVAPWRTTIQSGSLEDPPQAEKEAGDRAGASSPQALTDVADRLCDIQRHLLALSSAIAQRASQGELKDPACRSDASCATPTPSSQEESTASDPAESDDAMDADAAGAPGPRAPEAARAPGAVMAPVSAKMPALERGLSARSHVSSVTCSALSVACSAVVCGSAALSSSATTAGTGSVNVSTSSEWTSCGGGQSPTEEGCDESEAARAAAARMLAEAACTSAVTAREPATAAALRCSGVPEYTMLSPCLPPPRLVLGRPPRGPLPGRPVALPVVVPPPRFLRNVGSA